MGPDGGPRASMAMHDKYKPRIKLADQGENKCGTAEENGVSILHGNALAFVKGHKMKIQTIFEAFEQFRLGEDEPGQLLAWVVSGLQKVEHEDLASKCKNVANIDSILVSQLERQVSRLRRQPRRSGE